MSPPEISAFLVGAVSGLIVGFLAGLNFRGPQ